MFYWSRAKLAKITEKTLITLAIDDKETKKALLALAKKAKQSPKVRTAT